MKIFELTYRIYGRKYKTVLKGQDVKEVLRYFAMYMLGEIISIEEMIRYERNNNSK